MTEVETGREKLRNLFKVVILVRGKTGVWFQAVWLQVICYPANLLRKNNSKYFPSATHYCKNIMYVSTSSLHKHFTRYAHFLFISQTLSILPHSALGLERSTFGTEHFTLWSLVVFGQWEFPAWDQKVEEKWGHHTFYPSSLPFGSLWVGCIRFSDRSSCLLGLSWQSLSLNSGKSFLLLSIRLRGGKISLLLLAQGCSDSLPLICKYLHYILLKHCLSVSLFSC